MLRRLRRHSGPAALVLALIAVALSVTGVADAARKALVTQLKPGAVVRLDAKKKVPAKVLPTVSRAKSADAVGGQTAEALTDGCAPTTVDLGTWCLMASPYALDPDEVGKNDFFFATQKCVELGGWLPTAAQLVGAAARVRLSSTIADAPTTAAVDESPPNGPNDGLKDKREMSATLVTTAAGSSAAGSEGVSDGSRGDPQQGEPDPVPLPANPAPDTLQYVTVYDNGDKGGFAGSQPVSDPQAFRCAFGRTQGQPTETD